jgi:ADP-ribose pyrophosphatase
MSNTKQPAYLHGYSTKKVDPDLKDWNTPYLTYNPTKFTNKSVLRYSLDKKINLTIEDNDLRFSYTGKINLDTTTNYPLNPKGRTDTAERGKLYYWGPNHASDIVISRLNTETQNIELLLINRHDTGQLALVGGKADDNDYSKFFETAKREFHEEAMSSIDDPIALEILDKIINPDLYQVCYTGYVEDPRNTDNAWMEVTALYFNLPPDAKIQSTFDSVLKAGDDAKAIQWVVVSNINDIANAYVPELYGSHNEIIRQCWPLIIKAHSQIVEIV